MRLSNGTLLSWVGAALAGFVAQSALAAEPGFTTRIEPPADPSAGFTVSSSEAGGELAFTTRIAGIATGFSIDHGTTQDSLPRMRWSRPIGASLGTARFSTEGWTLSLSGGYGGDDNPSGSALLAPGTVKSRSGWSMGLEYDFGPWQLGGHYQFSQSDLGFTPAGQVESGYGFGANYNVAPGLSLFSEAFFYTDQLGRAPLAATQGSGNTGKSQSGKLYVVGTHLEW